jgi:tRNA-binding EMAP/Myf-like protein
MAFALRAVNSLAAAAPLRAAARRSARAPAARVAVRAMADEAPEAPEGVEQLIDVRVGKVIKAYKHEEADKLYVEEVDVGEAEPRQICSGLVPYMNAEVRAAHSAPDPPSLPASRRDTPARRILSRRFTPCENPHRSPETCFTRPVFRARETLALFLTFSPTRFHFFFSPEQDIEGQLVVVLANLKSRNMAGVASHGMLLCASDDSHEKVELLVCPEGAVPGERIKFGAWDAEQAEAHTENQMKKKKTWEKVAPGLRTTDGCVAAYKDLEMVTSAGAVTCKSIAGGTIG